MDRTSVVIAHYHAAGKVPRDLVELVQLLSARVERVVFVSTGISPDSIATLSPFAQVIARENVGYDFWSYKVGLEHIPDLADHDRVILLNSSFISLFPERVIDPFLRPVEKPCLRGVTISHELTRHIQSYWVSFEHKSLIGSEDFRHWWSSMIPISDRSEVIQRYELGMSDFFAARSWPVEAEIEPGREESLVMLARAIGAGLLRFQIDSNVFSVDLDKVALNPTHFMWDQILEQLGIIKVELIRSNPERQPLDGLFHLCQQNAEADAMITDALT